MVNSFEQICLDIKDFVNKHAIIQEIIIDDFSKFTSNNHLYPLLFLTPISMNIVQGQIIYKYNLTCIDIKNENQNLEKVLSDLAILIGEFFTYFDSENDTIFNYHLIDNSTTQLQPFYDSIDGSTGWQGEISFSTQFSQDANKIRFKE
jgi:hypothetical protein